MGPYCKFCGNRCFCHFPAETPEHILKAYGTATIIATCPGGQEFERSKVGYCYDDIMEQIRTAEHRNAADLSDTQDGYDWTDPEQNPYILDSEELARLERRLS